MFAFKDMIAWKWKIRDMFAFYCIFSRYLILSFGYRWTDPEPKSYVRLWVIPWVSKHKCSKWCRFTVCNIDGKGETGPKKFYDKALLEIKKLLYCKFFNACIFLFQKTSKISWLRLSTMVVVEIDYNFVNFHSHHFRVNNDG